jgi:hypothetical protein
MGNQQTSEYTIPVFVTLLPDPAVYYPPGKKVYCVEPAKLHEIINGIKIEKRDDFNKLPISQRSLELRKRVDDHITLDAPADNYQWLGNYPINSQVQATVLLMPPELVVKVNEQLRNEKYFCALDENLKKILTGKAQEGFYYHLGWSWSTESYNRNIQILTNQNLKKN